MSGWKSVEPLLTANNPPLSSACGYRVVSCVNTVFVDIGGLRWWDWNHAAKFLDYLIETEYATGGRVEIFVKCVGWCVADEPSVEA